MDSFFGYSLDDFKEEARELLNKAEGIIERIKANPSDPEGINALFRTIHSLKGSAGYVGIPEVNDFSHLYESFLGDLRSGKCAYNDEVLNILVRARDYLDDIIFSADTTSELNIDESIEDNMTKIAEALKSRSASSSSGRGLDAGGLQLDASDGIESVAADDDAHLGVSKPEQIVFEGEEETLEEVKVIVEEKSQPAVEEKPVQAETEQAVKSEDIQFESDAQRSDTQASDTEQVNTAQVETPLTPTPQEEVAPDVQVSETQVPETEAPTVEEPIAQEPPPAPEEVVEEQIETPAPETPASEMSQDEVIRVTIIKSINDLYESLKSNPVDMEKLEKSVVRLDDIVEWAFGDDAHAITVPLEDMRGIIAHSDMTPETVANLKKGFNMLVPAIKAQLKTLDSEEEEEEVELTDKSEETSVTPEQAVEEVKEDEQYKAGELTEEAEKLVAASRDEIVRITAERDIEEFSKLIEEEPVDIKSLELITEKLSDLNKWAFNEDDKVSDIINTITSLFSRHNDPDALSEMKLRGASLKSALEKLFGEKENVVEKRIEPSREGLSVGRQVSQSGVNVRRQPKQQQKAPTQTMKVSSEDLDNLITSVGKLRGINKQDFEALQKSTLQLRMVPVGEVFSRFRKITRDLSEELGKNLSIEITGEEVRLDKVLADNLTEPLLHLIRNAASHGIESNEDRERAGKGPAVIGINAFQEGGRVIIEVTDNGGGIDVESVREKGIKQGLISPAELEDMKEKDILELIFAPGFSTKESADNVSGRGVGMDVVRSIISSMQGTVTLKTKKGVGTSFRLQLPLTLAIIKAMVLDQGGNKIAVPASSIERVATMTEDEIHTGAIVDKGKMSLYMQEEGEVVPLINFAELFGGKSRDTKRCVVLLKSGEDDKVVIVVDEALGRQSLTVKPLDVFSETPYFSSASVVDNDIVLILNVPSLMAA